MPVKYMLLVALLCVLASPLQLQAGKQDAKQMIELLTGQISTAASSEELARLCCYRARHYAALKESDRAKEDYNRALQSDYKGWILLEFGNFLYRSGEFETAYNTAITLLEEFPYLEAEARRLGRLARARYEEQYLKENPPLIVMDTEVDPHRKSRHDYKKPQKNQVFSNNSVAASGSGSRRTAAAGIRPQSS